MGIFSLQSKIALAAWSIVVGILTAILALFVYQGLISFQECKGATCTANFDQNLAYKGWPFHSDTEFSSFPYQPYHVPLASTLHSVDFWENIGFWALTVFIVLSLIQKF